MKRRGGLQAVLGLALAVLLTGGCQDKGGTRTVESSRAGAAGALDSVTGRPVGWLYTDGNHIRLSNGEKWRGRGVNLHDTRSCNACAYGTPAVQEVKDRIDELVNVWKVNFIRLNLESYATAEGRTHWMDLLADAGTADNAVYFDDVKEIVRHIGTKPGVYVLLSLWQDPNFSPDTGIDGGAWNFPTDKTRQIWVKLAEAFKDSPHVLFGLCNEPTGNSSGDMDPQVWEAMNKTVKAIRDVEDAAGTPRHIITVQGTREWARWLDYYLAHPITERGGDNIAYETHVYDTAIAFTQLFELPARTLPIIIGEFGPDEAQEMKAEDAEHLMDRAEALDLPYLAWTFHHRCQPNLLVVADPGSPSNTECRPLSSLKPSPWGERIKARFARPWCASGCAFYPPRVYVYQDGLGARFEPGDTTNINFQATALVHSGTYSIHFEPGYGRPLEFNHVGLSASQFESLELWVFGGTTGQKLKLALHDATRELGSVELGPLTPGSWQRFSVLLDSVGASSGTLRKITLAGAPGTNQGTVFLDDIAFASRSVVVGAVQGLDTHSRIYGWAYDPKNTTRSIEVHAYFDGPYGSPGVRYAQAYQTPRVRSEINAAYGIAGAHGFEIPIPQYARDGNEHTVYVYGIDPGGWLNPLLPGGAPLRFVWTGVVGVTEELSATGQVKGWAMDLDSPTQRIQIHAYADGQAGADGQLIYYGTTDVDRPDVNTAYSSYGASGPHGFTFPIPAHLRDGKYHTLYVYGVNVQVPNYTRIGPRVYSAFQFKLDPPP